MATHVSDLGRINGCSKGMTTGTFGVNIRTQFPCNVLENQPQLPPRSVAPFSLEPRLSINHPLDYIPPNQRWLSETTLALRPPQMHSTLAWNHRDEAQFCAAAGWERSRAPSFLERDEDGRSTLGSFKLDRPLLVFTRKKGPEDFEKFRRTFEFYLASRAMERHGLYCNRTNIRPYYISTPQDRYCTF